MENVVGKALKVITSWLDSAGIRYEQSSIPGHTLRIKGRSQDIEVIVTDDTSVSSPDAIILTAGDFIDRHIDVGMMAFGLLTEAAGYGVITPVNRGALPEKKSSYREDFDAVAMRHMEFRAAPNPSPETLKKYARVVQTASKLLHSRNLYTCQRNGYDWEDLQQYALIWTINFIHKYELKNKPQQENEKLLMAHLKQRFWEFFKLVQKRERNINPTLETLDIALYEGAGKVDIDDIRGTSSSSIRDTAHKQVEKVNGSSSGMPVLFYTDPRDRIGEDPDFTGEDAQYIARKYEQYGIDRRSEKRRKKSASILLDSMLAELTPEKRIEVLTEAASNEALSIDARHAAARYLRELREPVVGEQPGAANALSA